MQALQVGDWYTTERTLGPRDTAHSLIELAASRAMARKLGEGERSISVRTDVEHVKPQSAGQHVLLAAIFLGRTGNFYRFAVEGFDDDGPIGRGEHLRAIIS